MVKSECTGFLKGFLQCNNEWDSNYSLKSGHVTWRNISSEKVHKWLTGIRNITRHLRNEHQNHMMSDLTPARMTVTITGIKHGGEVVGKSDSCNVGGNMKQRSRCGKALRRSLQRLKTGSPHYPAILLLKLTFFKEIPSFPVSLENYYRQGTDST